METFALPGAGAIIERMIAGRLHVLIQSRAKSEAPAESGLLEIPAGKIRAFENIYDCLRREVEEETGLQVVEICGELEAPLIEQHGYRVQSFQPFSCAQNLIGAYPILVMVFICRVTGHALSESNESAQIRWMALPDLRDKLTQSPEQFYPMHLCTLRKYVAAGGCDEGRSHRRT